MAEILNSFLTLPARDDGTWIEVIPLTYGRSRIISTDGCSVFNSW